MTPPNGSGSSVRDRARSGSAVDPQDGLFDKTWDDSELEAALEERERHREQRLAAQREFKVADDAAKEKLAGFHLEVGEVARVGRFRIKKTRVDGNSVAFDTAPRDQLRIGTIGDE